MNRANRVNFREWDTFATSLAENPSLENYFDSTYRR